MSSRLAAAFFDDLDDDDLAAFAERLRPLLAGRGAGSDDDLLTATEAADYLRCKRQRIYDLKHAGELTPERDGSKLLFRRGELDRYTKSRKGR